MPKLKKIFLLVFCFPPAENIVIVLQRPRGGTLNPTHVSFSYEDMKLEIEGGIWGKRMFSRWDFKGKKKQDSGVVEDFLELNWEHMGMCRGSEGILLRGAPRLQSWKVGFLRFHYFESFESIPVAILVS